MEPNCVRVKTINLALLGGNPSVQISFNRSAEAMEAAEARAIWRQLARLGGWLCSSWWCVRISWRPARWWRPAAGVSNCVVAVHRLWLAMGRLAV
ncbi:hypothetical protein Taro_000899 [Colocasia esculenta]|uniref:Uncharacterized protein n=1 Tax=Colocasia esculenta TaxID=4460 RepID=A0A843T9E5_COLES|nr:hypothetical protein [Colocasia esculenta]